LTLLWPVFPRNLGALAGRSSSIIFSSLSA